MKKTKTRTSLENAALNDFARNGFYVKILKNGPSERFLYIFHLRCSKQCFGFAFV